MASSPKQLSSLNKLLTLATCLGAGVDISVKKQKYCGKCDKKASSEARYCPRCGKNLKDNNGI